MTNQTGQWLTIRQAALQMGLSDLTVRRRIKDGKLRHRLVDGKYYVDLSSPRPTESVVEMLPAETPPADTGAIGHVAGEQPPAGARLSENVRQYIRLAEQAGRAAVLEQQLNELAQRYAQLQEGTISLANRNGWLESKLEERDQEIKLLADGGRRRSRWRHLFSAS